MFSRDIFSRTSGRLQEIWSAEVAKTQSPQAESLRDVAGRGELWMAGIFVAQNFSDKESRD